MKDRFHFIPNILSLLLAFGIIGLGIFSLIRGNPDYVSIEQIKCKQSGEEWDTQMKKCNESPYIDEIDRIEKKQIGDATAFYDISIFYPQFGIQKFDALIKKDSFDLAENFRKLRNEKKTFGQLIVNYKYYELENDNVHYLSVVFKKEKIIGSGERAIDIVTYVYDINAGKQITLQDITNIQYNPLGILYPKVKQALIEKLPGQNEDTIRLGTGKTQFDNYKHFYLDKKKIGFIFPSGQVADKKFGNIEIIIPFFEVEDILIESVK